MTIKLGKLFGASFKISSGSDDLRYLWGVVWYPRSRTRLGYLYPSVRWPF